MDRRRKLRGKVDAYKSVLAPVRRLPPEIIPSLCRRYRISTTKSSVATTATLPNMLGLAKYRSRAWGVVEKVQTVLEFKISRTALEYDKTLVG